MAKARWGYAPQATKTANILASELSRIAHFSPKRRVQDQYYNPEQPVIDHLLAKGKACIPLLIATLDDETEIDHQIMDYWPHNTIGDIALVILTDLTTDSRWTKSIIPGGSWNEILKRPAKELWVKHSSINSTTHFGSHTPLAENLPCTRLVPGPLPEGWAG